MFSRYAWLMLPIWAWLPADGFLSMAHAQVQALPAYTVGGPSSPTYGSYVPQNADVYLPLEVRMQRMAQRGDRAIQQYRTASRISAPPTLGSPPGPTFGVTAPLTGATAGVSPLEVASRPMPLPATADGLVRPVDLTVAASGSGAEQCLSCDPACGEQCYTWQILPDGLMYASYLAGVKEPRFASVWFYEKGYGWLWDSTLGGRVGILRHGTRGPADPEGWQVDIEGAAFPRLNSEWGRDLDAADFRFGIPLTGRKGRWQAKFAYYHLSSHLGDEYMVRLNTLDRINYARDCLVLGVGYFLHPDLRLYVEAGWAFYVNGGAEPWEFQFGVDYSPARPSGFFGAPFFAVNAQLREEFAYGGNFVVQTGWQWRGQSGHLFRIGFQYFNGMSNQYQFFDQFEDQAGFGLWYDY